jgi:hypothetical protein
MRIFFNYQTEENLDKLQTVYFWSMVGLFFAVFAFESFGEGDRTSSILRLTLIVG